MRLETYGAALFEDVVPSEASEFAEASAAPAPAEVQPPQPSQTLTDMAQQLPHWVNLAPANAAPASATATPQAPEPPQPEPQDAEADRSADAAFMAQHQAWAGQGDRAAPREANTDQARQAALASMLEQAQARLGRVDTFHHGVSEGFLDYASEMEFDAATTEVQRLEAEMSKGFETEDTGLGGSEPEPMDLSASEPLAAELPPEPAEAPPVMSAPASNRSLLNAAEQAANPAAYASVKSRTAESGDSWARIARQEYGDARYAQALAQANGASSSLLARGQEVMLPDLSGADLRAGGVFLATDAATRAQPTRSIIDGSNISWNGSSFNDLSNRPAPVASGEITADPGYVTNMRNILTSDVSAGDKLSMAWGMTKYAYRGSDTAQGTAQIVGGGLEVVGAAGLTTTGLGTALAVPLAFHGGDNIGTGINRIFGGGDGTTVTYAGTYELTGSRAVAQGVDQGIPFLGGVASLGQGLRLAETSVLSSTSYRALNAADAQALEDGLDLAAKAPKGNWSAVEHVLNAGPGRGGAQLNSPWISTTRDLSVAVEGYNGGNGLIAVNLNRLSATNPVEVWKEAARSNLYRESMAYHRAIWAQEVSVYQSIPAQAIYSPLAPLSQVPLTPIVARGLLTGGNATLSSRSGDPN